MAHFSREIVCPIAVTLTLLAGDLAHVTSIHNISDSRISIKTPAALPVLKLPPC